MFARLLEYRVEKRNQRRDAFERESLSAQVARLQDLLEKIGANQRLEDFVLINLARRRFEPLGDPAAAFRFGQMHEIGTHCAAINAAGFLGGFAGQPLQVRVFQRLEQAKRIERRLQIAPAAEGVEDTLALFVAGCFRGAGYFREVACRGFLGRFRRFCGALFFESCTVCHKSALGTFYFATEANGLLVGGCPYKQRTSDSRRRAISSGEVPEGKLTGVPMWTVISPKWARRRCSRFICQTPSRRIGIIGMRRFSASSPMPLWKGAMRPSSELLTSPSGNTSTLWPQSTDSPAKRKLSRNPENCGSGKILKSSVASQ